MLRRRFAVPAVAVAVTLALGAVAAAAGTGGDGSASAPPSTQPRPTVPPLTAPQGPAGTTVPPPISAVPPTAVGEEPTAHDDGTDGLSPEARAAVLVALGFDETSVACVGASFEPFLSDDAATVAILQNCGVSVAALASGAGAVWARGQQAFEVAPSTTATAGGAPADQIPLEDALYVSLLFLVPPEALDCLASTAIAPTATDDEALGVLTSCGAAISSLVSGVLLALPPGEAGPPVLGASTTVAAVTAPPIVSSPSTTIVASTAVPGGTSAPVPSGVPLDDPAVATIQQLFADQGITLSPEQAACIAGGLGTVDTNNMASMAALLDSCQVF